MRDRAEQRAAHAAEPARPHDEQVVAALAQTLEDDLRRRGRRMTTLVTETSSGQLGDLLGHAHAGLAQQLGRVR